MARADRRAARSHRGARPRGTRDGPDGTPARGRARRRDLGGGPRARQETRGRWSTIARDQRRYGILSQGDFMAGELHVLDHPLVQHKLTLLRNKELSTRGFRALTQEIGALLAYEIMRGAPVKAVSV